MLITARFSTKIRNYIFKNKDDIVCLNFEKTYLFFCPLFKITKVQINFERFSSFSTPTQPHWIEDRHIIVRVKQSLTAKLKTSVKNILKFGSSNILHNRHSINVNISEALHAFLIVENTCKCSVKFSTSADKIIFIDRKKTKSFLQTETQTDMVIWKLHHISFVWELYKFY